MARWLVDRLQALRTWIAVRLGLWRGQWRHGVVQASAVPFAFNPFVSHAWRYSLYAPGGLADDSAAPLIIVLHGCRQRASSFAVAAGLTALADRTRVRLLCPQQRRLANPYRCWNWFDPLAQVGAGELSVVLAMLDEVETQVRVDREAVAAVGFSAGGGLAALLAFHATSRLRASIVVAGPPLLGPFVAQDPREVMRRGLQFAPELALGLRQTACVPLAVIQGAADTVVHPQMCQPAGSPGTRVAAPFRCCRHAPRRVSSRLDNGHRLSQWRGPAPAPHRCAGPEPRVDGWAGRPPVLRP